MRGCERANDPTARLRRGRRLERAQDAAQWTLLDERYDVLSALLISRMTVDGESAASSRG
jgi:hypothetical protein